MHSYTTDAISRMTVPVKIGAAAVGLAFIIYLLLRAAGLAAPWWIDVPGPVGIGMILLAAYDRVIWRWRLGPIRLSQIPYVGGIWEGTITSTFGGDPGPHGGQLRITQTWSSIQITYESSTGRSRSHSNMASLNTGRSSDASLEYSYLNEPRSLSDASMVTHRGVAHLYLTDTDTLRGDYYTGRGRETQGEMEFRRVRES